MSPASATPALPQVSYLVLCHQHAPYLGECLASVEAQGWPNAEVIVLDNGSTDGSADLIRAWAGGTTLPVQLMLETKSRGICANANLMLNRASGEFVAITAADDYWLPHKTARQIAALDRQGPSYAVAYSDALRIDATGLPLEPDRFIAALRGSATLPSGDILEELVRGPFIPAGSVMMRRAAVMAMGPYDEELVYEDYDAWIRLATHWHFHADPEPLCAYRVLRTSAIHTIAAQSQPLKLLSDARIMAKTALIPRLAPKTRTNTLRRVARLGIELVGHEGNWAPSLRVLADRTELKVLSLLASAHEAAGTLDPEACHRVLKEAIDHRIIEARDVALLPSAFRTRLEEARIPHRTSHHPPR